MNCVKKSVDNDISSGVTLVRRRPFASEGELFGPSEAHLVARRAELPRVPRTIGGGGLLAPLEIEAMIEVVHIDDDLIAREVDALRLERVEGVFRAGRDRRSSLDDRGGALLEAAVWAAALGKRCSR